MSAAIHAMELGHYTCLAEKFMEMHSLAMRDHIVSCSMEDNHRGIGRIYVCRCVESLERFFISFERESKPLEISSLISSSRFL